MMNIKIMAYMSDGIGKTPFKIGLIIKKQSIIKALESVKYLFRKHSTNIIPNCNYSDDNIYRKKI